jgi:rhodanese-related sulfurtransferase
MSILPGLIYLGLLGGAIMKTESKIKKINVKDAVNNINKNFYDKILDVRTLNEFNDGHLENVLFYNSLGSNSKLIDKVIKDIPDKDGYSDISIVTEGGYTELIKSI